MYAIEKNIPVAPEAFERKRGPRGSKYPYAIMEVNDSFLIPYGPEGANPKFINKVQSSVNKARRIMNKTFVYAREARGIRVWRVA